MGGRRPWGGFVGARMGLALSSRVMEAEGRKTRTGRGDFELLDTVGPDGREDYRHFARCAGWARRRLCEEAMREQGISVRGIIWA